MSDNVNARIAELLGITGQYPAWDVDEDAAMQLCARVSSQLRLRVHMESVGGRYSVEVREREYPFCVKAAAADRAAARAMTLAILRTLEGVREADA